MTVSRGLFISSAIFSITIATVYWFISREPAGTTLLGFMAAALTIVALYMFFAERDANLWGDKPDATMRDAVGEHVTTIITSSPIPFGIGLALTMIVLGFVVSPAAAGLGIVVLLVLIGLMIVRSR